MFTPSFFINTIQDTKRIVTNKVFTDPTLNKAANDYITAQTAFANMLVNNAIEVSKYSIESVSKVLFPKVEEVTKAARAKAAKKPADTDTQGE